MEPRRIRCVGAVVRDDGRLLLVRRGQDPGRGLWSVPGGRVEPGESDAEAVRREVAEETGLPVSVGALAGVVERPAPGGGVFVIRDYWCAPAGGTAGAAGTAGADRGGLRAGSDAAEAGWFTPSEVARLDCVPGLVPALRGWGALPAAEA